MSYKHSISSYLSFRHFRGSGQPFNYPYNCTTPEYGTPTMGYEPNRLSSNLRRSSFASRAGRAMFGFSVPMFSWIFRATLERTERKGVGTVVGGVPSSVVSNARIECEESTLGGVPATRYVLTMGSTRSPYVDRAAKRAAVDCK